MKKSSYSITTNSCSCTTSYQIHQSKPTIRQIEQGTVMSDANVFKQIDIGSINDCSRQKSCCVCSQNIYQMELIMYGQFLSLASTYQKDCLCKHEIVVMTQKRVLIGKVRKSFYCCSGKFIDVLDSEDLVLYRIGSDKCQIASFFPSCLNWLCCSRPIIYTIYAPNDQKVGKIQIHLDKCCSSQKRYELIFPENADTKSKILLMNSLALLN